MFPVIGYVTRFEQQEGDRFSASVDVEVPEDVSHVQLDTEVFGSAAHAVPHRITKNVELANISRAPADSSWRRNARDVL